MAHYVVFFKNGVNILYVAKSAAKIIEFLNESFPDSYDRIKPLANCNSCIINTVIEL